jgi:hypothetical protein
MQLPLASAVTMIVYLQLLKSPALKLWSEPCPLCGAEGCAQFLGFYVRRRVYGLGAVYEQVKILRFVCQRLNPTAPVGTHRTFSLLPIFLIPYVRSSLDFVMTVAEELTSHAEIVYRATGVLISKHDTDFNATTTARCKADLHRALDKLNGLPAKIRHALGWSQRTEKLSALVDLVKRYKSPLHPARPWWGACALSQDWFYEFHHGLRYMQRDFLFGTASQLRF